MFDKLILNAAEAAVVLGYSSTQTIYSLLRRGELEGFKLPRHQEWRITRKSIEAYIERCAAKYGRNE